MHLGQMDGKAQALRPVAVSKYLGIDCHIGAACDAKAAS